MAKKKNIKAQGNRDKLLERQALFTDLMDQIPDVIYFKDRRGRLVFVNRAHAKGLRLKPEQVIGKTDFDFFSKERAKMMMKD
ncbi:MAG: PAS domain S-box protein, partial [Candidatus Omnitrophica bacterium]|nr:PAS domain S-box protein [Candidatus Omnitrophota bacterium]